jgi:hypothetical protein
MGSSEIPADKRPRGFSQSSTLVPEACETWDHIEGALIGVATTKVGSHIEAEIPEAPSLPPPLSARERIEICRVGKSSSLA